MENFSLLKLNALCAAVFDGTASRSSVKTLVLSIQTGVRHEREYSLWNIPFYCHSSSLTGVG